MIYGVVRDEDDMNEGVVGISEGDRFSHCNIILYEPQIYRPPPSPHTNKSTQPAKSYSQPTYWNPCR